LHIAWRGDTAPADAAELARLVTGRAHRAGAPAFTGANPGHGGSTA
jgi:hypothetical protein